MSSSTLSFVAASDVREVSRLRVSVLRLARRLRQQGNAGVTPSQLAVLGTLARLGPLTLSQLAEAESVQPPSMTRIVAALSDAGLVVRKPVAWDRRAARVEISARGRRAIERLRAERNTWLLERLSRLDAAEQADLWRGVTAIERLLEERA